MSDDITGPVLLICDEERQSYDIIGRLNRAGVGVIGPVTSAAQAMMLAGQLSSGVAIVARRPTGRRNAFELARDLMSSWGIRSWVLPDAASSEAPLHSAWAIEDKRLARLKQALGEPSGLCGAP